MLWILKIAVSVGKKRGSGWCSAPSLGRLPSEFCLLRLYPLTLPPPKAWFGGCITSHMSEVVRISHHLTQHPHCMGKLRTKETHGINLLESRSLKSQAFPPNLKVSSSVPPSCCAPALASYASTVSRPSRPAPSQPGLLSPWPPAAARSSHTLPGTPSQTSHLQRFYDNSLLPPPFSPQGTVLSLPRPFSRSSSPIPSILTDGHS